LYRHFRVNPKRGGSDTASLGEIAARRVRRLSDWGLPDLIIVDGGKAQTRVFWDNFHDLGIPVVGLAKRFETLIIPVYNKKLSYIEIRPKGSALALVTRLRDEAHRFARRYHHKLINKNLLKV
jgi:excinuclease ABC subunit C